MDWRTKLVHPQTSVRQGFQSLAAPTYRGSTVLFDSQEGVAEDWRTALTGYTYGLCGTPTVRELAGRIADLEGAYQTVITPRRPGCDLSCLSGSLSSGQPHTSPGQCLWSQQGSCRGSAPALRSIGGALRSHDWLRHCRTHTTRNSTRLVREPRFGHDGGAGPSSDRRSSSWKGRPGSARQHVCRRSSARCVRPWR